MNDTTTAAVAAASGPKVLSEKVMVFVQTAKTLSNGGLTIAEFGELMVSLLHLSVDFLDSIPDTGEQKKAYALEAVALLYDELFPRVVPLWAYPAYLMFAPIARPLVLALASGALESILPLVRSSK